MLGLKGSFQMSEGESDFDVDIVNDAPDAQPPSAAVPGSAAAMHDGDRAKGSAAAELQPGGDSAAENAAQPERRGRGRPRKNFAPPVTRPGPKRGPGRPRNSELLARFANSHRPPGASQLLPDLVPAIKSGKGKKPGKMSGAKGKTECSTMDGRATNAQSGAPARNPSRWRHASVPGAAPARKGFR